MKPAPLGMDALLGLAAAFLWVIVSAFRCNGFSLPWLLSGWAAAALVVVPFVVVLRRARFGTQRFSAAVYGALIAVLPCAIVGALLSARTHHRALGAVTFAFVAVGIWALGSALANRLQGEHERSGRALPRIVLQVSAAISVAAVVLMAGRRAGASGLSPVAMDAFIGCVLSVAAIRAPRVERPRWESVAGVLTWALVVAVGILSARVNRPFDAACSPLPAGWIHGFSAD